VARRLTLLDYFAVVIAAVIGALCRRRRRLHLHCRPCCRPIQLHYLSRCQSWAAECVARAAYLSFNYYAYTYHCTEIGIESVN